MTVRTAARAEIPAALRQEVRLLGDALGEVIAESAGGDLLGEVERLRRAVIAVHDGTGGASAAEEIVAGYAPERAEQVARAFTVYFQLVNLAEERARVRALRAARGAPRPDSFAGAVAALGADAARAAIRGLSVHPVLTAHPTEARRRAVQAAVSRIGVQLDRLEDPRLAATDRADGERRLLEEVTLLWRTAQVRHRQPDPLDEVRAVTAVFDDTLFRMVPRLYRAAELAVHEGDPPVAPPVVPPFLRYGSWVGGDRDGNPNVTASVTRAALDIQAEHALRALATAAERIARTLTLDAETTPPTAALRAALQDARDHHPALSERLGASSAGEPHRQFLLWCAERFAATHRRDADLAYPSVADARADLRLLADSLAAGGATRVAYGELQHLRWQLDTFGFHLASLEVRQHSDVHRRALRAYGVPTDADGLVSWLARAPGEHAGVADEELDPVVRDVLPTLRAVAAVQHRWGVQACHRYVVSFTHDAADLLAVRALARLAVGDRPLHLDVVPLFETEADLAAAVPVLERWLALGGPPSDRRLEVMLGYSDSAKDVGPVAATLALHEAQAELVAWSVRRGIELTLFHGRGGALGRGGGPAGRAVLSGPPGSLAGGFKVTEQGEVISARYGHSAIALRHLEQVSSAVLLAGRAEHRGMAGRATERYASLGRAVADAARAAYRSLVDAPGFADFFAAVSPVEELGRLHMGSRPARRGGGGGDLRSLRAIPWVFAWSQTRVNLPGWYGLGTGLAAGGQEHGATLLREAYESWPLFTSLVDNAEMSLAKADRAIAERYLALGGQPALAAEILAELDRTVTELLALTGHERLLGGRPVLSRAVALRNPYVDALSYLQLRALAGVRADPDAPGAAAHRRVLLLTINGIAAGLQNTG